MSEESASLSLEVSHLSITRLRALISTCAWLVSPDLKTNVIKKVWNASQYFFFYIISFDEKNETRRKMRKTSHLVLKNELLLPSECRLCFKYLKIFQKIIIEHKLNGMKPLTQNSWSWLVKKKAERHQHSILLIWYEPCSFFLL